MRNHLLAVAAVTTMLSACSPDVDTLDTQFYHWTRYEAEPGATHFSALDQINRSNVGNLEVAWVHESTAASAFNPIVVDSLMYVFGDSNTVKALHAGTGKTIWTYSGPHRNSLMGLPRAYIEHGVAYWESEDRSDRRLLVYANSNALMAINARTGDPVITFGDSGLVDLRQGLDIDPVRVQRASSPSPGAVFEDLIILGSSPGEGYTSGPGHIRAINVVTGRQEWIFHTLPKPGEFGYDTWPEGRSDEGGGANAWGGLSVDTERGIVYIPLGSANYDFYGVDRHGQNLFANSLVALDARTGERKWHFQMVHHDLWDYDLTATPTLLTVEREGEEIDIVVQATKTGFVYAFDRETGEPLWPIEEVPVPPSEMPGEQAWPTQPFPTKPAPFIPQTMSMDDFNPHMEPRDRDSLEAFVRSMLYKGMFTPPDTQPTLQTPGNRGGANFSSTAGDPRDGTFYVLSYNMPSVLMLEPITSGAVGTGASLIDQGQAIYQANCQICHRPDRRGQPVGGIPSLEGVTDRLSHDVLKQTIINGRGLMPANPQLSDEEYDALQSYLANPELALTAGEALTSGRPEGPQRYQSGWNHILDSKGVPVIKPPWFRLTAYDMNTGDIRWQVPVGEVAHLVAQGITDTGAANWIRGGPAITGGNLIFQPGGETLWAYDREDGSMLWRTPLPGLGEGVPAVYEVNGRQYVVVSVGSGGMFGQAASEVPPVPGYYAFALPE